MSVFVALVLWGFVALLVATEIYYVVKRAVRDALREHEAEHAEGSDSGQGPNAALRRGIGADAPQDPGPSAKRA